MRKSFINLRGGFIKSAPLFRVPSHIFSSDFKNNEGSEFELNDSDDEPLPEFTPSEKVDYIHETLRYMQYFKGGNYNVVRGICAMTMDPKLRELLRNLEKTERDHLDILQDNMPELRVRPSLFTPFHNLTMYGVGNVLGFFGPRVSMTYLKSLYEISKDFENDTLREMNELEIKNKDVRTFLRLCRDEETEATSFNAQTPNIPQVDQGLALLTSFSSRFSKKF
mmetsp:Transcript_7769/g.8466  ORF Transcript_7769/g.8466 Transcript_7769/m.8466 type:complete len:223 (-) Transcript_7769:165-833(-)